MTTDKWNNQRDRICRIQLWYLINKLLEILRDAKTKGFNEKDVDINDPEYDYVGFIDGAFNVKDNVAGYGYIIYDKNNNIVAKESGAVPNPEGQLLKNVAGELLGTIKLVDKAIQLKLSNILIMYDYYGIEKYYRGDWISREPFIKNNVLKMKELNKLIKIGMRKAYSHTGVFGNEVADSLAKLGAKFNIDNKPIDKNTIINEGKKKPQVKVEYLKKCWKIIFKFLTLIEMTYLNNNINNLNLELLLLNLKIKATNLDIFLEKNFNLSKILDPIDDNMF